MRRPSGIGCTLAAWAVVVCLTAPAVRAQPAPTPSQALSARLAARIKALQREADQLAAQARTVFGELRSLEITRAIAAASLEKAEGELQQLTRARDTAQARLARLESQRVAETPGVQERLVALYKRGRGGYLRLLLAAGDPGAFGRATRAVAAMVELDRVRVDTHRRTIAAERVALAEVEARRAAVERSQQDAARARASLDTAMEARERRIAEIDARRDLAAQYVGELQAAQQSLQRTLASLGTSGAPALPLAPFKGDLDWPARGPIRTRFGRSTAGRFGTSIVRNGVEIGVNEGTPVRAVHGGTVAYAAPFTGFGTLVILDHGNGAFTLYGHLRDTAVTQGQRVAPATVLGTAGHTPAGPPAVYFEVRIDGRPVDPLQWLRSSP